MDTLLIRRGHNFTPLPNPELIFRKGMGEGAEATWDVGAKMGLTNVEVSTRHGILQLSRWRLAWGPMLGIGFQPVTLDTNDLLWIRGGARVMAQLDLGMGWGVAVTAYPNVELSGPLTVFRGRIGEPNWQIRTGGAFALKIPWSRFPLWGEISLHPTYSRDLGWEKPAMQMGISLAF